MRKQDNKKMKSKEDENRNKKLKTEDSRTGERMRVKKTKKDRGQG